MRLIGTHMDTSEIAALDAIAQSHRVPRAAVIRWAITQYLRDVGDPAAGADPAAARPDPPNHSPERPSVP